jgi:TRAP-type C4-dicarboxylate transport system substrate-binding protein
MELTVEEKEVLTELLTSAHSQVLYELHRTDSKEYKKLLKRKVEVIESLHEKLKAVAAELEPHVA